MRGMFINMLPPPQMLAAARAALFAGALVLPGVSHAQNAETDCPQVAMPNVDDPSLTREEKIALLDQALLEALNQTDPCEPNAGGATGSAGADGADGENTDATVNSQAAGDVQGDLAESPRAQQEKSPTETTAQSESAADGSAQNNQTNQTAAARASDASRQTGQPGGRPEKLPSDIPASEAANDDIIAKQFREAAEQETDPKVRAQLWNDYRRYKGLPVQSAPEDS